MDSFSRTELLVGREAMERLRRCRVAVFGIGGVGGSAAEALARCGVGAIDLFDSDRVSLTNLNRQVIALHSTLGRLKVDVMAERLLDIHPDLRVEKHALFYLPENADTVDLTPFDYVVDAVDTVAAKLELIQRCQRLGVPILSAMGAGNRLDPGRLKIGDVYETSVCRLARVMRRELRKRGVTRLTVAYSTEEPLEIPPERAAALAEEGNTRRAVPGSVAFVPPAMGMLMASRVIRDLIAR